jgi:DNA-binding response OmpR family regulator
MVHILYIEDEKDIGKWVTQNLKESYYRNSKWKYRKSGILCESIASYV